MQKSKTILYLSLFSAKELQRFRSFVESPYFNKHQKTIALFHYIQKQKQLSDSSLDKETVFKALFPKKKFDIQLLSNLNSYLLKLIRQFLIQQQMEKKTIEQQLELMEICFDSSQQNLFELTAGKLRKAFQNTSIKDSNHYLNQTRFNELLDDFNLNFGNRSSGQHLEKALEHFDIYFISKKLKMACQVLARNQVTAGQFSLSLIPELLSFIEERKTDFLSIPSIWVYYLVYNMITNSSPNTFFQQLKNTLPEQITCFELQEGRDLYTHLINYCIKRVNLGETAYRREAFEFYRQMLEPGLLYTNGILAQWDYTNIVSLGCLLEEYEWVEHFIHEQKEKLSKGEKENTFNYNLASFYYNQKDFGKALSFLRNVIFTEVFYDLLTRILMVKIYFEQEDWKTLEYELEKFRIYLLRNKNITELSRQSALNLLRFSKSLMRFFNIKSSLSKKERRLHFLELKEQIEKKEKVLNKEWLLQRLESKSLL